MESMDDRIVLRRKAYDKLLCWKNESNGHTAALVDGARRTGKSFIVKKFAKEQYRTCIFIDFNLVSEEVKDIFTYERHDLDVFFARLSQFFDVKLHERESVLVFDEVQLFPIARSLVKYIVEDGRYDCIETGSLISISRNTKGDCHPF